MSNSRNDWHRNSSYKNYDDDANGRIKAVKERNEHRRDKRITNALRGKKFDFLLEDEDDF